MMLKRKTVPIVFLAILTALTFFAMPQAMADTTVKIGQADILLTGPDGMIRVDGLDPKVDALMEQMQPDDSLLLSVYAEPVTWKNFKEAVNGAGTASTLDYYAIVGSPKMLTEVSTSEADFVSFKNILSEVFKEAKLVDSQDRFMTYDMDLGDGGRMIGSAVLVQSRIVLLNLYSSSANPYKEEAMNNALAWRDRYLAGTSAAETLLAQPAAEPGAPEAAPAPDSAFPEENAAAAPVNTEPDVAESPEVESSPPADEDDEPEAAEEAQP